MTPAPVAHAPSMDELLTRLWPIVPSSVVMRREVFDRIGGFSPAIAGCEDIYFWLMAREQGEFRYLPEKLARFAYDTYPELLRVLRRDIEGGTQNLIPMLHQRYGHRADALAAYYRRHKVSMLSRAGLLALAHGDAREARQCFLRAMRWNPAQPQNVFALGAHLHAGADSRRCLAARARVERAWMALHSGRRGRGILERRDGADTFLA